MSSVSKTLSKPEHIIFIEHLCHHLSHRELLSTGPSGLILSTDDYFAHRDGYHFERDRLGAAHEWNQSRGIVSLYMVWDESLPCHGKSFQASLYRHVCQTSIRTVRSYGGLNVIPTHKKLKLLVNKEHAL